jgi:hypothetical protein
VVLTYITTTASGFSAFQSRTCCAVMPSASEQPARVSGINTVFSGLRTFAVSAMKWTPQKTIRSARARAASIDRPSESPV